ncbi:MAG TPA: monovalent cation:proton antiporter-2 (CPA2) family protein [Gammaproteobacteria bacterium]|nr:monovalent cation:proton antiporter-2 (CPA2) family protein [Gammaproteobacteria bacterium]
MHPEEFLLGSFVYLAAAVIAAPLFTRLGLGSVLGYLIAGIVIGPSALGLTGKDTDDVMHFAEFGVIVMLFLVGLELQPAKLWELRKPVLGLGTLQVGATAAVIGAAASFAGYDGTTALVAGLALAMSSTAIVLQSLGERGLLKTSAGRSSFAVLLFQDVSVIPMLALLPLLSTQAVTLEDHALTAGMPGWARTLAVLGAVGAIAIGGRYLTQPLFRWVAGTGLREIFVAFALVIVVGIALLMQLVGLSAALGTFLAGVVLADSEYRHELEMDLEPFKGLLLAVFFIAVGSGIDFALLARAPLTLLGIVAGIVALKLLVLLPLARLFRMPRGDATRFAFSLAQGGEFAFVLVSFALGLKLLHREDAALLVAAVAISMALAPLLMLFDDRVLQRRFATHGTARAADRIEADGAETIIAGHGRFGMTIGRLLQANGVRAVVLDHDAEQIDVLRRFGFKVFYGDATRIDLLEAAGAKDAKTLVIAIDDREKSLTLVETARRQFPHLAIFARAFDRVHAYELLNAGITHVYREVFGSSVDMGRDVLTALGRHPFEAQRAAALFKAHDERMTRASAAHQGDATALIDLTRKSRAEIANVLAADRGEAAADVDPAWSAPERDEA